jgi:GMP synthase-like glutamine amidotransferase
VSADRVLVLQHQDDDGPGHLATYLAAAGVPWDVVDVTAGLPEPGRYGALVVLGSKESAFDDTVPWIPRERTFVAACAHAGTPVLGICFGAQLLAIVLGGSVRRMSEAEYGWTLVGGDSPIGGTWFMWHQDEILLPPGAVALSRGARCLHVYASGDHLGVQYHPEVGLAEIEEWLEHERRTTALANQGVLAQDVIERTQVEAPGAQERAYALFASFFDPLDLAVPSTASVHRIHPLHSSNASVHSVTP